MQICAKSLVQRQLNIQTVYDLSEYYAFVIFVMTVSEILILIIKYSIIIQRNYQIITQTYLFHSFQYVVLIS